MRGSSERARAPRRARAVHLVEPVLAPLVLWLASLPISCGDPHGGVAAPSGDAWTIDLLVRRTELDPAVLWPLIGAPYVLDPAVGLLLAPEHRETWSWSEHPRGRFGIQTNNLGFLEGEPTRPEKRGVRILALGDSHMMVVDPAESYPNLLEAALRGAGYPDCEVLNSGVGYTGPRLYLRRLERYLELAPDVVLVSFFSGNDLWDDLQLEYDIGRSPRPALDADYAARLERCRERHDGALYQGLNQAHFFKHWPGTAELSLRLALDSLEGIHQRCEREGRLFLVVFLPTKIAVDVEDEPPERADALLTLGLSEEEAALNERLVQRLAGELARRGIPCLDPSAAMRADPTPFFWRRDHHLSVAGHAFLARAAFAAFEPLLAARGWKTGQ